MALGWHWDEGGRVVVAMGLQWDHARGHGGRDMVAMGRRWDGTGVTHRDTTALGWQWDEVGRDIVAPRWHWDGIGVLHRDRVALGWLWGKGGSDRCIGGGHRSSEMFVQPRLGLMSLWAGAEPPT